MMKSKSYIVGLRWPIFADYIELEVQATTPTHAKKIALATPNLSKLAGWVNARYDGGVQFNWVETREGWLKGQGITNPEDPDDYFGPIPEKINE